MSDLTDATGTIGFFSDVHGNHGALHKALYIFNNFQCEKKVFLGDAIGYIPSTHALDEIVDLPETYCIRGNHEDKFLSNSKVDKESVYQFDEISKTMTLRSRTLIQSWPLRIECEVRGAKILCVHGTPDDPIDGYLYPDSEMKEIGYDFVFVGNTHRPFVTKCGRTTYVNVGSVGIPRDIGHLGSLVLFDPETFSVRIVRFDISESIQEIVSGPLNVHDSVLDIFKREVNIPMAEGTIVYEY